MVALVVEPLVRKLFFAASFNKKFVKLSASDLAGFQATWITAACPIILAPFDKSPYIPWFSDQMVAQFTMRTYGVEQEFRFLEGIWFHRKSSQIRFFFSEQTFFTS